MSINYLGASERLAALFEQRQGVAIAREQVVEVASQLDALKRLRRNGGACDILDCKGIALLSGKGDRELIARLRLGPVLDSEFISYTPCTDHELRILQRNGHAELNRPPNL